jgi:biopolymer transport protein ExbD
VPPAKPHSIYDDAPLLPKRPPHPEDLIDMTAMVDIVFFLLIFFLVTSLQALESVMDMPTPQAAEGSVSTGKSVADLENDPNFITVRIEDDDSIWVEDTQVFNDQDLARKLRAARKETGGPRSLLVIGDADASHGAAVRVFDAGAGAGVTGISLIVQEKSEAAKSRHPGSTTRRVAGAKRTRVPQQSRSGGWG